MKLKKALGILNFYAFLITRGDIVNIETISEDEEEELNDAIEVVKEFLEQFK